MTTGELSGYDDWLRKLQRSDIDEPLVGDGVLPTGVDDFLRDLYRQRGALSPQEVEEAANERELSLARHAATLVERDVYQTTGRALRFQVDRREVALSRDVMLVITLDGGYQTPVMSSLRHPESTVEVADYMQDHITSRLHAAWPVCPVHDRGLHATTVDGDAVWLCKAEEHVVASIGQLGGEAQ